MSSLYNAFLLSLLPAAFPMETSPKLGAPRARKPSKGILARLANGVARVAGAVVRWRQREALRQELMAMDDHLLADIGIRREQIPHLFADRLRVHTPNPLRPWTPSAEVHPLPPASAKTNASREGDKRPLAA